MSLHEEIKFHLPLFKFRPTIVWIDDDPLFLKVITKIFSKDYLIKTFDDPNAGLDFLKNYSSFLKKTKFLRGCIDHESYDISSQMPVNLNMMDISALRSHPEKNNEICVIVVDYKMPDIDGLSICRSIKDSSMKKILLTGEADYSKAVNGFNEGIIDCFIRKDSVDLADQLRQYIPKLVHSYFCENSQFLLTHLEVDELLPLSDPLFIQYFEKFCIDHQIKEHYLIDKHGSFCVVDGNNKIFYLIVHTEKALDAFVDVYKDKKSAQALLKQVNNRELIPFFGVGKEAWEVDSEEWTEFFHKPVMLEGSNQRYYVTKLHSI